MAQQPCRGRILERLAVLGAVGDAHCDVELPALASQRPAGRGCGQAT
jgi:hypothetical protein